MAGAGAGAGTSGFDTDLPECVSKLSWLDLGRPLQLVPSGTNAPGETGCLVAAVPMLLLPPPPPPPLLLLPLPTATCAHVGFAWCCAAPRRWVEDAQVWVACNNETEQEIIQLRDAMAVSLAEEELRRRVVVVRDVCFQGCSCWLAARVRGAA